MIAWLALSLCFSVITTLAIWSRRPTKARGMAVIALLATVPLSGGMLLIQRGWATPLVPYLSELPEGEVTVLGAKLLPETAIYVWLDIAGEPRAFVLPWSAKSASQLQRALEQGNGVKAKKRTGHTDDDGLPMEFMGEPQASLPEKQPEAALRYERSAG